MVNWKILKAWLSWNRYGNSYEKMGLVKQSYHFFNTSEQTTTMGQTRKNWSSRGFYIDQLGFESYQVYKVMSKQRVCRQK